MLSFSHNQTPRQALSRPGMFRRVAADHRLVYSLTALKESSPHVVLSSNSVSCQEMIISRKFVSGPGFEPGAFQLRFHRATHYATPSFPSLYMRSSELLLFGRGVHVVRTLLSPHQMLSCSQEGFLLQSLIRPQPRTRQHSGEPCPPGARS